MRNLKNWIVVSSCLMLFACASPMGKGIHSSSKGSSLREEKTFSLEKELQRTSQEENSKNFVEKAMVGVASWYGPGFYGRRTASGERFNKFSLTCAHRTLPFGTRLEIVNLLNGKTIEVTVNDRGPYIHPRIVDLSYGAARELGLIGRGTALVQIRPIAKSDSIDSENKKSSQL